MNENRAIRFIRWPMLILLLLSSFIANADTVLTIEDPAHDGDVSGIGLIGGWAISDVDIASVEVFIDGESIGYAPYGGSRFDVGGAYPGYPNSSASGWAMKWNHGKQTAGSHTLTVVVTDRNGQQTERSVEYRVNQFESSYIADPQGVSLDNADIVPTGGGELLVQGAVVEGRTVDLVLRWDTSSQQFRIIDIRYTDAEPEPVQPANEAPRVDAGADRTVTAGDAVTLSGSASDSDGSIVSWRWSRISGSSVALSGSDTSSLSFSAPGSAGVLVFNLSVTDDDGESATDQVRVTVEAAAVENQSPSVNAGADRSVDAGERVSVTGTATDTDGSIVRWVWRQVSGDAVAVSGATSRQMSFTAPSVAGTLEFELTATDDDGASSSDRMRVTVQEAVNQSPTANAGADQTVQVGDSVSITGSGSDADGSISSWRWTQVSGLAVSLSGSTSRSLSFTSPSSAGTLVFELTVTDNDGASDSDRVSVQVQAAPNQSPTVNAGADQTVSAGDSVSLSGSAADADGSIASWKWTQVSGASVSLSGSTGASPSFTAPNDAGTLRFQLSVTDDDGATASDQVTITVEADEPPASASLQSQTLPDMLAQVNAARAEGRYCGDDWYDAAAPLAWSGSLAEIARLHGVDMATVGFFSHTSSDGTSWSDRVRPYWTGPRIGENLYTASVDRSYAQAITAWLNSPGHCRNFMSPNFTHVGLAKAWDPNLNYTFKYFWSMDLGG